MSEIPQPTEITPSGPADKSWAAIVSLISGIVAVVPGGCCCLVGWPLGIAAIIFGVLGLKSQKAMFAKIGIGLGVLAFVITVILWILSAVLHIAVPGARNPGF